MSCKSSLFPILEEEVGPLGERTKQLVATLGMIPLARFVPSSKGWIGRPSKDCYAVPCAFGAKAVYGFTTQLLPSTVSSPGKWRRVRRVQPSTSRVRVLLLQQAGHVIVEP